MGDGGGPAVDGGDEVDDVDDVDDDDRPSRDASVGDAGRRDGGRDGGRDAGRDSGRDAGRDARTSTDALVSPEACTPSCSGRVCGSDGCGGSCGTCATGACNASGQCECQTDTDCSSGTRCFHSAQGNQCIATCDPLAPTAACPAQQACNDFSEDSAGNLFSQCSTYGSATESASCTESTDCALGLLCARFAGNRQCARPCNATQPCVKSGQSCAALGGSNNQAAPYSACNPPKGACVPSCSGKTCGSDGCGGSCGTCSSSKTCNSQGTCVSSCVPSCGLSQCGSDGCGGSCGSCGAGKTCSSGQCVSTTTSCDPVDDWGCTSAEGCYLLSSGQATCAVTGTGTQGSSCTTTSSCAGGYGCFAHVCRKICAVASGDGCTASQTCNGVSGWTSYGACN